MIPDKYVSDMTQAIARSICEARGVPADSLATPYLLPRCGDLQIITTEGGCQPDKAWKYFVGDAEAALKALLAPTTHMLETAKPHMDSWSSNLEWWNVMIKAALQRPMVADPHQ